MSGDDRERGARIGLWRLEATILFALEAEDAVAQDAGAHDRVREAVGPGAQILGDDQAARPMTFQPQDREHGLERISHIGALRRRKTLRDEEQARELEGV